MPQHDAAPERPPKCLFTFTFDGTLTFRSNGPTGDTAAEYGAWVKISGDWSAKCECMDADAAEEAETGTDGDFEGTELDGLTGKLKWRYSKILRDCPPDDPCSNSDGGHYEKEVKIISSWGNPVTEWWEGTSWPTGGGNSIGDNCDGMKYRERSGFNWKTKSTKKDGILGDEKGGKEIDCAWDAIHDCLNILSDMAAAKKAGKEYKGDKPCDADDLHERMLAIISNILRNMNIGGMMDLAAQELLCDADEPPPPPPGEGPDSPGTDETDPEPTPGPLPGTGGGGY